MTEDFGVNLVDLVSEIAGDIYRTLGAGYAETVYEEAMGVEFRARDIAYEVQRCVEITYKGEKVGSHRLDFVVAGTVVVELKAATSISKSHVAQLEAYLETTQIDAGMLINFPYPEAPGPEIKPVPRRRSTPDVEVGGMPVIVFANTIGDPDRRALIQSAVLEGIGDRSSEWTVRIHEPQHHHSWTIRIDGPEGLTWQRTFEGPDEQDPEFIREAIAASLPGSSLA